MGGGGMNGTIPNLTGGEANALSALGDQDGGVKEVH
jgi:hypothetical protein